MQAAEFVSQRTIGDSCHGLSLITVRLLESVENIGLRPVGEHLADDARLIAILLSKLGKLALVLKGAQVVVGGLVIRLVAVGSAAASTGETSSAASARAPAAGGRGP